MSRCLALLAVLALSGCVADQTNAQNANFKDAERIETPPAAEIVPDSVVRDVELHRGVSDLRAETQRSNNAVQQSLSGLGVNLAKVAEKFEASLIRVENKVETRLEAHATATAELTANVRASLTADVRATAQANAAAVVELEARLTAKISALAAAQIDAQAGIANKLQSFQQTVSAGRDSTVTNQFTTEMQNVILKSYSNQIWTIVIAAAVICFSLELSRRRADRRACEARSKVGGNPVGHVSKLLPVVVLMLFGLAGCKPELTAEQKAVLASAAIDARERAAAFDVVKLQLKAKDEKDAPALARILKAHGEGLNAQAAALADLVAAIETGSKLSKRTRESLQEEAATAMERADRFKADSASIKLDGELKAWADAHYEALHKQVLALVHLANLFKESKPQQ